MVKKTESAIKETGCVCNICNEKFATKKLKAEHHCNTMAKKVRAEKKKEEKRGKLKEVRNKSKNH